MSLKFGPTLFGKDTKAAYEQVLQTPQTEATSAATSVILPRAASAELHEGLSSYIILPGRKHGSYEYPDLLVSKTRIHHNKTWNDAQVALLTEGKNMLALREYVDFLAMLSSGPIVYDGAGNKMSSTAVQSVLEDIVAVRNPWRAEWLDAKFSKTGKTWSIATSHILDGSNTLSATYTAPLSPNTIHTNKTPGIDLIHWLTTANEQGLPTSRTNNGSIYYWSPRDGTVARFGALSVRADLSCGRDPRGSDAALGVRPAFPKP